MWEQRWTLAGVDQRGSPTAANTQFHSLLLEMTRVKRGQRRASCGWKNAQGFISNGSVCSISANEIKPFLRHVPFCFMATGSDQSCVPFLITAMKNKTSIFLEMPQFSVHLDYFFHPRTGRGSEQHDSAEHMSVNRQKRFRVQISDLVFFTAPPFPKTCKLVPLKAPKLFHVCLAIGRRPVQGVPTPRPASCQS